MAAQSAEWVKMKKEDFEKIVLDLAKKGTPLQKIGLILRDQHGIPKAKVFGKRISQILKEAGMEIPTEEDNLERKTGNLKKHIEKNKHDYPAKKSLIKNSATLTKIKRSQ
jgi:small subunit ribosomal protein S15